MLEELDVDITVMYCNVSCRNCITSFNSQSLWSERQIWYYRTKRPQKKL